MIEFRLPSLGADMDDGTLLEWMVKPGDKVQRGQVVAVVDTTKAAIDVECWDEGTVDELIIPTGTKIPVNTVLALLRESGETLEHAALWKTQHPTVPVPAAAPGPVPGPAPAREPKAAPAPAQAPTRRRISPAARHHAEELGIALDTVVGTGPEGAVLVEDVERAAHAPKPATGKEPAGAAAVAAARAAEMRRTIAAAMARSKREIPHYYLELDVPLEAASRWLAEHNATRPITERLLMAALFIKAVAKALVEFPELNGFIRGQGFEPSQAVHVGVAISLRQGGLVAPALLDADKKPLDQLMRELTDLVKRTRAFSLRSSEMSMPTVTLTNLGDQGADAVFGVIYPPQVALIGFGTVRERAWAHDGAIKVLAVVRATLAADHRASDGHRGAMFLARVAALLQQPEAL
jgi:pyruvate dehydrogenase E2 component (dihydrolipoamide acetyltransferase)